MKGQKSIERPTVFVGSSREGIDIARAIQYQLKDVAFVKIWDEGVFGLMQGTLEGLVGALERFDFAVLVITPDDMVTSRKTRTQAPRDNILLELGLFIGRLGLRRTFALCSDDPRLKLPSDLAGVTIEKFHFPSGADEITSSLGPACYRIRHAIREFGPHIARELKTVSPRSSDEPAVNTPVDNAKRQLSSPERQDRKSGINALEQMDDSAASDALADALRSPYPDVRKDAALVLARKGDARANSGLVEILKADLSGNYRDVRMALDQMGAKAGVVLEYLLQTRFRLEALEKIKELSLNGKNFTVEALRLLKDEQPQVRVAAIDVIVMAQERKGIPALVDLLDDGSPAGGSSVRSYYFPLVCDHAFFALLQFNRVQPLEADVKSALDEFRETHKERLEELENKVKESSKWTRSIGRD